MSSSPTASPIEFVIICRLQDHPNLLWDSRRLPAVQVFDMLPSAETASLHMPLAPMCPCSAHSANAHLRSILVFADARALSAAEYSPYNAKEEANETPAYKAEVCSY